MVPNMASQEARDIISPGRKAKFTIFLFPAPFALENSWGIYSTLREGVTS